MREVIGVYIRCWMKNKVHSKVFQKCELYLTLEDLGPELLEKVNYHHKRKHQQHLPIIERGIAEGLIIDVPPMYITMIAAGMLQGVTQMVTENHFDLQIDDAEGLFQVIENVLIKGFTR